MSDNKRKAVVICPGRGSYNREELGYLSRHHADKAALIEEIDRYRLARGQTAVSELDAREKYDIREHTRGDNASPLIHACAYADFLSIDRDRFDIVAITGNSMGWYIALACGAGLMKGHAVDVVNTMGTWMQESLIGGQLIYPLVDEDWKPVAGRRDELVALVHGIHAEPDHRLYLSIDLGGSLVFGGDEAALAALEKKLEPVGQRYPFKLPNHAAFHTSLQKPISERALGRFGADIFRKPAVPLIDGCGRIWSAFGSDPALMRDYTFGHQICRPYDFAAAMRVAVREFAPDNIIVLGPGNTLGASVAQCLIGINWKGLRDRSDFTKLQGEAPFVLSMGRPEQRPLVEGDSRAGSLRQASALSSGALQFERRHP